MAITQHWTRGLWLLALVILVSADSAAQSQNSAIVGIVKDGAGAPLPGASVEASSPILIERARRALTDRHGAYKILELGPGTYTVTFSMAGFGTVQHEGLELPSSFTATIHADMRPGGAEEILTLFGDGPGLDTRNVANKAVTSRRMMDDLPTDRNFTSLASMTPAIQVAGSLQNVGGSDPETRLMLRTHGSRIGESRLFVDGMSVMSGNGAGGVNFGNYLNNAMVQELVVNTDANSAEFELAGVASNFISRQGSNVMHGAFTGRYASSALQGRNLSDDLVTRGLTSGNRIQRIWDANPSASGPLMPDRVWLFSSVRQWGTYNYTAGLYDDVDPRALFYTPDLGRPAVQRVWHANADARLTVQATPTHKIGGYYHYQYSDFGMCLDPSLLTAPSGCPHNKNDPQWFAQATWSAPLTRALLVDAGATITAQSATGRRDPGVADNLSAITESSTGFTWRAPTAGFGGTRNNQSNYRAAVSYVAGRHTTKAGLTLMQQWRVVSNDRNNDVNYVFNNGAPTRLVQFAEPATFRERVNYNLGLYAQDQWSVRRLTLNLGVRADFLNAQVDAQSLPAGLLVPAREFDEINDVPRWSDLSPRLGAAYDLFGSGRTVIKATLGRYVNGESYTIARAINPLQSTVPSARRNWNDNTFPLGDPRRGDFIPDCDLTNVASNGECGAVDQTTFGQVVVRSRYDEQILEGFGVRPYNWGTSLSVEHEMRRGVSASIGYFRRWYGNSNIVPNTPNSPVTQNRAVTNADFTHYCIPVPADGRLPNSGGRTCGFYDVSVATFGATDNFFTSADTFGTQEDVFDGVDVGVTARRGGMFLSGGLSTGRQRTNNCYAIDDRSLLFSAMSPRTRPYCDVRPPMLTTVKMQIVYPLPWWGIQLAATVQSIPGQQILAQQETTNAQILPSLGRNLSSCNAAAAICNATVLLDLLPPGTLYGDRVNQVDFRVTKTFKGGRTTIRPMVSVYNLLNANPVLAYNNRYGPTWPAPTAILNARFADVGVQIDF